MATTKAFELAQLSALTDVDASGNVSTNTSQIANASGNLTIDSAGDIFLNADGADIVLADDTVNFGSLARRDGDFVIKAETVDKDIILRGTKSGSPDVSIDALVLDMSADGDATFNSNVKMNTGSSTGKFAVMATSVHGSYDFYNNGTSYFNDTITVDGNLVLSDAGGTVSLKGPAIFTIDPAGHGDDTGTVVIAGNLQVDGTTTTINSTTVSVDDKNLTLASGSVDATTSNGAGLTIDVGTNSPTIADATFSYTSSNDTWALNKTLTTSGDLQTASHSFWRATGTTSGAGVANGFSPTTSATGASSLSTGSHYVYRLTTTGTGTNSGATYIVWYEDDNNIWKARAVSLARNDSNHPLLDITSGGAITIYTNHSSVYGINYTVERVSTVEPDGLAHSLGEFYNWQRLADDLFYTDGNVGIGTGSPNTKLHVKSDGTGNSYGSLYLEVDTATNYPAMVIQTATGGNPTETHGLYIKNTAAGHGLRIDDEASDTSPFVVTSDSKVGIGTVNPDERLDVRGHIKIANSYLKVRRTATYDQAWDIGITHANASQHGSLFIYPPSSQTIQSTSGVVMGTGNTGSNYPFILNGDGILTMDHQPSANVYVQSSNLGAYNNASSNSVIVAAGIRHNIGSHYNTSNGRFTCPTSGRYFVSFSANWYNNGAGTWLRPQIRRNGATHCQHYENTASNPAWMHISASTVIDCSAGDYLEIYNQTQNGAGGGMDTNQYSNINFHKIA